MFHAAASDAAVLLQAQANSKWQLARLSEAQAELLHNYWARVFNQRFALRFADLFFASNYMYAAATAAAAAARRFVACSKFAAAVASDPPQL